MSRVKDYYYKAVDSAISAALEVGAILPPFEDVMHNTDFEKVLLPGENHPSYCQMIHRLDGSNNGGGAVLLYTVHVGVGNKLAAATEKRKTPPARRPGSCKAKMIDKTRAWIRGRRSTSIWK